MPGDLPKKWGIPAYGHTGVTTNVALDNNTIYPIEGFEIYN